MDESRRRDALRSSVAVAVAFVVASTALRGELRPGTVVGAVLVPVVVLGLTYHPGPLPARTAKAAAGLLTVLLVALALWLGV